jgi:hypothetical protein
MDRDTLNAEWALATEEGDTERINELQRLERNGAIADEAPQYAEGSGSGSTEANGAGESSEATALEGRIEQAAQLNERVGAEDTAEALRRIKGAENPQSALQKARRRAESMGDDYNAEEFAELLDE